MKLPIASSILLLSVAPLVHADCLDCCLKPYFAVNSSITIADDGIGCSFGKFKNYLDTIRTGLVDSGVVCAELMPEVLELFGVDRQKFALEAFKDACEDAEDVAVSDDANTSIGNFRDILGHSNSDEDEDRFLKEFYDGNTPYNQQVQERAPGRFNMNRDPGQQIEAFFRNKAREGVVEWPSEDIDNFNECKLDTVMCCWVTDRRINNDGNGDCEGPYPASFRRGGWEDSNCVDANPADNTDVCYVDHERSPQANHVAGGFTIFEGDAEGDTHCHGFVWTDDETSTDFRYKANTLFYVSMRDHMKNRGYVRNVPGAPMCGCVEQMPTVERADCTQTSDRFFFKFDYNEGETNPISATVVSRKIQFAACDDENGNTNDLRSKFLQLRNEADAEEFSKYVPGVDQCPTEIVKFLATKNITPLV